MKMDGVGVRGGDKEKGGKRDKSEQRQTEEPEDEGFIGEERGRRWRSEAAYQKRGEVQEWLRKGGWIESSS